MLFNSIFVELNKTDDRKNDWIIKVYMNVCEHFKEKTELKFGLDSNKNIHAFDSDEHKLLINFDSLEKYYKSAFSPNMSITLSINYASNYLIDLINKWKNEAKY